MVYSTLAYPTLTSARRKLEVDGRIKKVPGADVCASVPLRDGAQETLASIALYLHRRAVRQRGASHSAPHNHSLVRLLRQLAITSCGSGNQVMISLVVIK